MDVFGEILKQGGLGILAAVMFWLFLGERKDHKETRAELKASQEARIADQKENADVVVKPLEYLAESMSQVNGKLKVGRGR